MHFLKLSVAAMVMVASATTFAAKPKVVIDGLDNPSGITVHERSSHIFLCSREGVHRLIPGKPGKVFPVVAGFETDIYGKGPMYNIGPLGIACLGDDHIVVGDGSRKDGAELVRVYKIGDYPTDKPMSEDDAAFTLGPIEAGDESARGEGNFYGVAVNDAGIFVTANGDDTKGWVAMAAVKNGKPGALKPYLATKVATGTDAPVAITFAPDGHLVIGQMGEMNVPNDSLLTMYDAKSKELKKSLKTGLHDIAGLAYSPKTGKLYGVDFAWADTKQGGLFELMVDGDSVKTRKVVSLDKPTSLAFDAKGNVYVTVFGTAKDEASKPGQVLMIKAADLK